MIKSILITLDEIIMVETLTAAIIAKLAFDGAIQGGAGKLTEAALGKCQQLWQKIRGKLEEDSTAKTVIVEAEQQKSQEILEQQVVPFLQVAMIRDPRFAKEIENIAKQINQEITSDSQRSVTMTDFEAKDNSVVMGSFEGEAGSIGGTHEKK